MQLDTLYGKASSPFAHHKIAAIARARTIITQDVLQNRYNMFSERHAPEPSSNYAP